MGSGKSSLGKQLSEKLNFRFVDLDKYIEEKLKKPIAEIFEQHGENFFRQTEADCLRELGELENTVIATGGGTPCFYENMNWLNKNGATVYLKFPPEILFERLLPLKKNRPLLAHMKDGELLNFIEEKLAERENFYLQSNYTIENPSVELILNSLPFGKG